MDSIEPAAWADDDRALWARIAAHDFEPADAPLTFAGRLARDHGWTLVEARAAIDAYRRFCFLAVRAGREVTPSEEVDEVWHQHLTYSRDYWQVWCRAVLRRDLHHGPTRGGAAEGRRFAEQYADTLAAHEAWFGPPPPALWPGTAERFGRPRFHVVDRATHVAVPLPRGLLAGLRRLARAPGLGAILALASARPAAAAGLGVLDWTAGPFLALYLLAAAASVLAAVWLPPLLAPGPAGPARRSRFAAAELGFLAAGGARAADVMIVEDLGAGRAALEGGGLTVEGRPVTRAGLAATKAGEVARLGHRLAEEGLVLAARDRRALRTFTAACMCPALALGLAKACVGGARGKPVGILVALLVATALVALVLAAARSSTSRRGRAVLAGHRAEHARALRAPRSDELAAAFALAGAGALSGSAYEPFKRLIVGTGGTDGGGSGGSDGGGCGGGGCGGCGGGD